MAEPKWGDVALVKNEYGVWNRAICQVHPDGTMWTYGGAHVSQLAEGSEYRPMLVIDPEDRDAIHEVLRRYYSGPGETVLLRSVDNMQAALRDLANPAPAIPDEPTDPAVRVVDRDGGKWARCEDDRGAYEWCSPTSATGMPWDYLSEHWGPLTIVTPDAPTDHPFRVGDRVRVADDATWAPGAASVHRGSRGQVTSIEGEVTVLDEWRRVRSDFLTLIEAAP